VYQRDTSHTFKKIMMWEGGLAHGLPNQAEGDSGPL